MTAGSKPYVLDDPRPIAVAAPYTYFLPSPESLAAIEPGDLVKLLFRNLDPTRQYGVERMWVSVSEQEGDLLSGILDNAPSDMPGVKKGDLVSFDRFHVIDVRFKDSAKDRLLSTKRQYWDRCLVDRCVLYDGVPVGFIYRETPTEKREGDKDPDSGWRIRGDARGLSNDEVDARECAYVALGAVLNRDDSWLALIDEPEGSAFLREFSSNTYVRQTND